MGEVFGYLVPNKKVSVLSAASYVPETYSLKSGELVEGV
jgi:hypothetical protein